MKKISLIVSLIIVLILTGCTKEDTKKGLEFKKDYESLNGLESKSGKVHRELSIDEDNPFIEIEVKELLEKIENKETFYVYFGDKLCPWCRSVIEKAIEVAIDEEIDEILYIPIWDDEGNEILRDKYELKNGKAKKTLEGTKEYEKLLKYFDKVLSEYNLTDSNGKKISTGEKRIYAPNFIYVEKGKAKKLVTGISERQKDSREELTKKILKDEEEIFEEFFK